MAALPAFTALNFARNNVPSLLTISDVTFPLNSKPFIFLFLIDLLIPSLTSFASMSGIFEQNLGG